MISYMKGKIVEIDQSSVSLFLNNIAFKVYVKENENFVLGEEVKLYVFDYLKDELFSLYGFKNIDDYLMFKKLINVNGIGPKTALTILSNIDSKTLIYLIKQKDIKTLKKYPGIGNKAEAIVISLYSKIKDLLKADLFRYKNVFEALKSLGYKEKSISDIIYSLEDNLSDEEALKEAIRRINAL